MFSNILNFPDVYLEESSSSNLSAVIDWCKEDQPTKNEDLFNSLMSESPTLPLHLGPKLGRAEPKEKGGSGPKLGSTSLLKSDEKEKSSKFKVLHSTLGTDKDSEDDEKDDKEDPLSSAISSILSEEEKQELLLNPLKQSLKSAGIELAESAGEEKQNFVLRVKSNRN